LSGEEMSNKIRGLCEEWHQVKDVKETLLCVEEMIGKGAPGSTLIAEIIKDAYGATKRDFGSLKTLFTAATTAGHLAKPDFQAAFTRVLVALGDDFCDNPNSPAQVGGLAGHLVAQGFLDLKTFCEDILTVNPENADPDAEDPALLDAGAAVPTLAGTLKAIAEHSSADEAKAAWNKLGRSLLDFHPSFEREDGQKLIDSDVAEYGLEEIVA